MNGAALQASSTLQSDMLSDGRATRRPNDTNDSALQEWTLTWLAMLRSDLRPMATA